ncbi:hypothetical protein TIFTF001_002608 [Ficus carica]|uniref:AB hydrolase-1 domain-containing protein n=1 Tax=Ficus carica TaxID=3494 RepID=A0AA88D867_FICCA|nr:hypothetical protein TIFTF001_002608 [Ficus carica]
MDNKTKHFVLVHGICHGAWCWYRLVPLLESAGHRVTALDLSGSGVHPKRLEQVTSFHEYVQPLMELMESLPHHEKVVLVGHSYGGMAISLATELFPKKISVAIYVTAFVPNSSSPPATLVQEISTAHHRSKGRAWVFAGQIWREADAVSTDFIISVIECGQQWTQRDSLMDLEFSFDHGPENPPTSVIFGPNYMAAKLYQHCQTEDLILAKMLLRPSGLFLEDLAKESMVTSEKFGSVRRVFVVCEDDGLLEEDFQRWLIENSKTKEVKLILGADHMVMLSKPQESCLCLLQIVEN